MNSDRRTLIQSWILLAAYALVASLWESSRLPPRWSTEIFTAASLLTIAYFLFTAWDLIYPANQESMSLQPHRFLIPRINYNLIRASLPPPPPTPPPSL